MFNISVKASSLDVDIVIRALENGTAEKIMTQKVRMAIAASHFFDKLFFKTAATNRDKLLFFRFLPLNSSQKGKDVEQFFLRQGIRVFHSDRFLVGERGRTFLRISLASCRTLNDLYVALTDLKKGLTKFQK